MPTEVLTAAALAMSSVSPTSQAQPAEDDNVRARRRMAEDAERSAMNARGHLITPSFALRAGDPSVARAELLSHLAAFDRRRAILRDFVIPHLAYEARERLEAEGIATMDPESFRSIFLARTDEVAFHSNLSTIDGRIVEALERAAKPLTDKVLVDAIATLEEALPLPNPALLNLCEQLGLAPSAASMPISRAIAIAIRDLREMLTQPALGAHTASQRDSLGRFFTDALI